MIESMNASGNHLLRLQKEGAKRHFPINFYKTGKHHSRPLLVIRINVGLGYVHLFKKKFTKSCGSGVSAALVTTIQTHLNFYNQLYLDTH